MRTKRPECHTEGRGEEGPSHSFWAHSPVQETEDWVTTIGCELALCSKCWEGRQGWNWGGVVRSTQRLEEDQKRAREGGSGLRAQPGQTITELRRVQDGRSGGRLGENAGESGGSKQS